MRVAVVADVHANLFAAQAVGAKLAEVAADRVICLGDTVGYNAHPAECIAWVREHAEVVVAGNHDVEVVTAEPEQLTNPLAKQVQAWTRDQLSAEDLEYLGGLPAYVEDESGLVAVHGCYLNEIYYQGYVTTTMLGTNLLAIAARDGAPKVALCGHTHLPMCGWLHSGTAVDGKLQSEARWPASADAVLINPGSVGQPRDRDPRASFAVVDVQRRVVELFRTEYDVELAARAVLDAGLPRPLAQRLREGR